ncbi:MAG TPA: succinate dehydrogenase assembly factor 2 [Steroidobacteraceae bacterium]
MSEGETRSRLAWRCRRGSKELDLLLLGWLARSFESATAEQRAGFAALLELPDPELASYLLGTERPRGAWLADAVEAVCPAEEPSAAVGI